MKTKLAPGVEIETITRDEMIRLLADARPGVPQQRVRAAANIPLNAAGAGEKAIYTVPAGWEFEARRVVLDLDSVAGPSDAGRVVLDAAGESVEYLRGETRIEFGQPEYGSSLQIPGSQTWGKEQGPYLRNDEAFVVRVRGLTANANLRVTVEGILYRTTGR